MVDSSLPMKTLGEVLSVVEAGSRPLGGASSGSFGVPSLGAENIRLDGTLDLRSVRYIPKDFFYSLRTGRLEPFDILINTIGAQIGKVGRYMSEYAEAAINGNLALLRCVDNILPGYLFYYLQSEGAQHDIRTFVMGSVQPYLSPDFFVEMNIPFPSIKEQQQITEMFDDIDEAIRSIELIIIKCENIRIGLIFDLLNTDDASLGDASEWQSYPLNGLGTVAGGGTPSRLKDEYWGGSISWITPGELTGLKDKYITNTRERISGLGLADSGAKLLPAGSL